MEILVHRKWCKEDYTVSRIFVDGSLFCNGLEDADRGLSDAMDEKTILERKVYGQTAIPRGRYTIDMNTISPKYSSRKFYKETCDGKVPRINGVKGFEGILIHAGNTHADTSGCILVGNNTQRGRLTESQATFKKLYALMKEAHDNNETIYITIN